MEAFFAFGEAYLKDGLVMFLIRALILYVTGSVVIRMVRGAVRREIERRGDEARTPVHFIGNVAITLIRMMVILLILNDIKPLSNIGKTILGATSLAAVIAGLATKEASANLVAGFFLSLYQPFRLGDLVSLPGKNITGTVEKITLRHTVIKTYDETEIVIPNATLNSEVIENKQMEVNKEFFSKQIVLSVSYDSDLDLVRRVITETVTALPGFIDNRTEAEKAENKPPVTVTITDFLDSGIEVRFRVSSVSSQESFKFTGAVREAVIKAFRENGITIPYPTRTVEIVK